jgi:hypothetical protein
MSENNGNDAGILTLAEIKGYRALAARYPNTTGGRVINRLLDAIQAYRSETNLLRAQATTEKSGPYSDNTLMPFGRYRSEPLCEVPDDYLRWFTGSNNRHALFVDAQFQQYPQRAIAQMKLRLFEYAAARLHLPDDDEA